MADQPEDTPKIYIKATDKCYMCGLLFENTNSVKVLTYRKYHHILVHKECYSYYGKPVRERYY